MNRFFLIVFAALSPLLFGCATPGPPPEPRVVVKEVKVPTPVSCVPDGLPPAPVFSDTRAALLAAAAPEDRSRLVFGNWFTRAERLGLLEEIVRVCRKPPAPP